MTLSTSIIDDESDLDPIRERWDALAVRTAKPFCAPAWMLAWWRNARPQQAGLRVIAVTDGDQLVGLAALYALRPKGARSAYEVMAAQLSPPAGLLVEPTREAEVCEAIMAALATARPKARSIRLWDRGGAEGIAEQLAAGAAGRKAWVHVAAPTPLPVISLDDLDYQQWLATLHSKFRQESRRMRRRLDDEEARFSLVGAGDLDRALDAFIELHGERWQERGGSNALIPGFKSMFTEAAAALVPLGRMRIFTIEVGDQTIAVNILVAAGSEVCGWNSGFDQAWGRYSPSMQLTLHAIADATERGERRVNLGPGRTPYKSRLADFDEEVALKTVMPRDSGYLLARLGLAPYQLRDAVGRRLSADAKRRLRSLARR